MIPVYEIDSEASKVLLLAAREGLPVILMSGAISGMQGPATMAGCLVMQAAEELAGLCVVQTVRPGSPCLMNWGQMKLDMRTAEIQDADPEYSMAMTVGAQLSRKYGVPSYACPASDSKVADFQAGFEMAQTLLNAVLSGINVTVNAGTASKCSAASYELMLLHNEMLRSVNRICRGMTVNGETLALDVQKEIGIRGEYLTHPHTLRYVRDADGKDRKLPSGIIFDSVENISTKKKKTNDVAYLYFFPTGMTEDVIIRLNGEKANTGFYSLRVSPANAKTVIVGDI